MSTGVLWDKAYKPDVRTTTNSHGPHHFNVGQLVKNNAGRIGRVTSRSALYAQVRWFDDATVEEVEQLDPAIHCC